MKLPARPGRVLLPWAGCPCLSCRRGCDWRCSPKVSGGLRSCSQIGLGCDLRYCGMEFHFPMGMKQSCFKLLQSWKQFWVEKQFSQWSPYIWGWITVYVEQMVSWGQVFSALSPSHILFVCVYIYINLCVCAYKWCYLMFSFCNLSVNSLKKSLCC